MIQQLIDFVNEVSMRHAGETVQAWVQYIPMVLGAASSIYGAIKGANAKKEQARQLAQMEAENKSLFNQDYYGDYTQTQEAQNMLRQAREMFDRQAKRDANTAVITGASIESQAANKDARNRAMGNIFANLGAQGTRYKERAKDRYLNKQSQLQAMKYGKLEQDADSAMNLMSNGGSMDWASIMGSGGSGISGLKSLPNITQGAIQPLKAAPVKSISGVIPSYNNYTKKR